MKFILVSIIIVTISTVSYADEAADLNVKNNNLGLEMLQLAAQKALLVDLLNEYTERHVARMNRIKSRQAANEKQRQALNRKLKALQVAPEPAPKPE